MTSNWTIGLGLIGAGAFVLVSGSLVFRRLCTPRHHADLARFHSAVVLVFMFGMAISPGLEGAELGALLAQVLPWALGIPWLLSVFVVPTLPFLYGTALPDVRPWARRALGLAIWVGWLGYLMGWAALEFSFPPPGRWG